MVLAIVGLEYLHFRFRLSTSAAPVNLLFGSPQAFDVARRPQTDSTPIAENGLGRVYLALTNPSLQSYPVESDCRGCLGRV